VPVSDSADLMNKLTVLFELSNDERRTTNDDKNDKKLFFFVGEKEHY
jgi:hypothetical protein